MDRVRNTWGEKSLDVYGQLVFSKGCQGNPIGERTVFSKYGTETNAYHLKKQTLNDYLKPDSKIISKWIINLDIKWYNFVHRRISLILNQAKIS